MSTVLLDPSIGSANVGDQIIRQKVDSALEDLVNVVGYLPTQTPLTRDQRRQASSADVAIIGGTNLLSSNMPWYRQWKVSPLSARSLRKKVVLLGVGWWQYQSEPNSYTRWMLDSTLSRDHIHSVRDEYTRDRLAKLGYAVENTACPTMWDLESVRAGASRPATCVVTLTDYNRDPVEDQWLLDLASNMYENVVVWPQSVRDVAYAKRLTGGFTIAAPTLSAYDSLLSSSDIDYVGTRLHGGIRAFDQGLWGLIVAVDNRAIEIGRDTNLPVFKRGDRAGIQASLEARETRRIELPAENIAIWKNQFPMLR